jgi:hypothetical protein
MDLEGKGGREPKRQASGISVDLTYPQLPVYHGQNPVPSVSSDYITLDLYFSVFLQLL